MEDEMVWLCSLRERAYKQDENLTAPSRDAERAYIDARVTEDTQVRAAKGTTSEGEEESRESKSSGEEDENLSPEEPIGLEPDEAGPPFIAHGAFKVKTVMVK